MDQRISPTTLGVAEDVYTSQAFGRGFLGAGRASRRMARSSSTRPAAWYWPSGGATSSRRTVPSRIPAGGGGVTLAYNVGSPEEVDRGLRRPGLQGREDRPAGSADVLGRVFRHLIDPDGHPWRSRTTPPGRSVPTAAFTFRNETPRNPTLGVTKTAPGLPNGGDGLQRLAGPGRAPKSAVSLSGPAADVGPLVGEISYGIGAEVSGSVSPCVKMAVGQDGTEFAEFYRASWAPCLRAVGASVADPRLAEDLVAEAFTRGRFFWPDVSRHPAPRGVGRPHCAQRRGFVVATSSP